MSEIIKNCTLNGVDLPNHFRYNPYIPTKRVTRTQTAGGVVTQYASPQVVHGDGTISWRCPGSNEAVKDQFLTWYNTDDLILYSFTGYWGEEYEIEFAEFDKPEVQGRVFSLSGMFVVHEVIVEQTSACD